MPTVQCPTCNRSIPLTDAEACGHVECAQCNTLFRPVGAGSAPMIRFGCPACRKSLKSPAGTAGAKAVCPKCGQKVRVPNLNKTTLGLPALEDVLALDETPAAPDAKGQGTAASPAPRPQFTRRLFWLAVTVVVLLGALIVGGTWLAVTGGAVLPFSEESVVRRYVLDNADDPRSVEFGQWGPNDDAGRVAAAIEKHRQEHGLTGFGLAVQQMAFPPGSHIIRVRYRSNNRAGAKQLMDMLYSVKDGKVVGTQLNPFGDDWQDMTLKVWGLGNATRRPSP